MNNTDRAAFVTVAQLISWGADLNVVPASVRQNFANFVMNSLDLPPVQLRRRDEIISLIRSGSFISAIKVYREVTNEGLKEAKAACEKLRDELGLTPPRY